MTFLFVVSCSLFIPVAADAALWKLGDPLVPCGTVASGKTSCGYYDVIQLIQNIIAFLLWLAAPIATLLFAYAGFLYLTARDDEGQVKIAHQIFIDVLVGVFIMVSAFLIVYIITDRLLQDPYRSSLPLEKPRI